MITLNNNDKLQVVLAGSVTTSELPVVATWKDVTDAGATTASSDSITTGTTAVDIVSAPSSSGIKREIQSLVISNDDTASATVTLQYDDNGTTRIIFKCALAQDDTVYYDIDEGFKVTTTNGRQKTLIAGAIDVDSSGNVGINTSSPSALLHIAIDSGSVPSLGATTGLVISNSSANSDSAYISIIAGNSTGVSAINFGDTDDEDIGSLIFRHANNELQYRLSAITSFSFLREAGGTTLQWYNRNDASEDEVASQIQSIYGTNTNGSEDAALVFDLKVAGAAPAEQMRLNEVGLGIGESNPAHKIDVVGTAGLSTGTAWTNTSDERVKDKIVGLKDGLKRILSLEPVEFEYNADYRKDNKIDNNRTYHGFTAQQMQTVFPDDVTNSGKQYGSVDNVLQTNVSSILPNIVGAIKDLANKLDKLEAKLA